MRKTKQMKRIIATVVAVGVLASTPSTAMASAKYTKKFTYEFSTTSIYANTYCSKEGHRLKTVVQSTQKHLQTNDIKKQTDMNVTNGCYKSCGVRVNNYNGYRFTNGTGKGYVDGTQV